MRPLEFRIAGFSFTLRLWPTLLTALMFAVLMGLGVWQVERLQWKENLIREIEARRHEAPLDAATLSGADIAEYRPIEASGLFQHDHEFYMPSISKGGEGGYHIVTPLQLDGGKMLLVDRGWVPYDKKLPATRLDGQLFGPTTVHGLLRLPHHHWGQPVNRPATNEWYSFDLPMMAKMAEMPQFLPFVLEADATANPGGYPVGGQTRIDLPNNHFGYALTWFGLAAALLVIYGVSATRKLS